MTDTATVDADQVNAAVGRVLSMFDGTILTYMLDLGYRTGLLDAAAKGPATSAQLAARAGLVERYVREWLGAMVTGGIFEYDATTAEYRLPPAFAACFSGAILPVEGVAALHTYLGRHLHQVARAFREGGGVPYADFRPEFTGIMDHISRQGFDRDLISGFLPLAPGLRELLEEGAEAADVACGTGHALVLLAQQFPASTFVGYDLDDGAIASARAEAAGAGLANVRFEVADAARLDTRARFDAVFVFDAIHDQVDPSGVLRAIAEALKPGGVLLMKEPHAADHLEHNIGNPFAVGLYGISTLHCLTVSLAHDGAGIGTAFGERLARQLLTDAGFDAIAVHPAPGDPRAAIYVGRASR